MSVSSIGKLRNLEFKQLIFDEMTFRDVKISKISIT